MRAAQLGFAAQRLSRRREITGEKMLRVSFSPEARKLPGTRYCFRFVYFLLRYGTAIEKNFCMKTELLGRGASELIDLLRSRLSGGHPRYILPPLSPSQPVIVGDNILI